MLGYRLVNVTSGSGEFAAVRDHSIIIPPVRAMADAVLAVVHLSHVLVAPEWRRSGLAGWMRAFPLQMARDCLRVMRGAGRNAAIVLVAEMEPPDGCTPERLLRLAAYEKAGFRAIDPAAARYFQPDFATPEVIAAKGKADPLPMNLVIRRVGREQETSIDGREVRRVVDALYKMYAAGCRAEDILALKVEMEAAYPEPGKSVRLIPPTQAHN